MRNKDGGSKDEETGGKKGNRGNGKKDEKRQEVKNR